MGKTQRNERMIYGIKIKRREAKQNWKEERKKKSNREKDYGRLRSVKENERALQKEKNGKRRLN